MNRKTIALIVVLVVLVIALPILLALFGWLGLLLYLDSLSR
jgi:hypothetical protein